MPFFKWETLIKTYPQLKNCPLTVVCGPRNIGKTTATYPFIKKQGGFTENAKVLILRNTDKEIQFARTDFNNRFKNIYQCQGNMIYSLKRQIIKKDDEEIEIFCKDKHIGYMAAISTYTNMKSAEAKDVKFIFYEEFNEDTSIGRNIYKAFINIITTFIRFSNVKMYMLGNKDGFMSDFYVNWNIIPQIQNDKDVVYPILDGVGYWIELGNEQFKDLGNQNQLFYKLAMADNRTKAYLEGGYLQGINPIVVNYKELIGKVELMYYLAVGENKYSFNRIKGTQNFAILSPWNFNFEFNNNVKTYSVDLISRLVADSKILDNKDLNEILTMLLIYIKRQQVYFDSYDTLEVFKNVTLMLKNL